MAPDIVERWKASA